MAYPVEARLDIAFQHPFRRVRLAEYVETLGHRIRCCTCWSEPIRVRVARRFRDGFQSEQVEGLHRPVTHRWDAEGPFLAVAFRDIHAPQGPWLVAAAAECLNGRCLLLWRFPRFMVNTRCPFPLILRHSSHS